MSQHRKYEWFRQRSSKTFNQTPSELGTNGDDEIKTEWATLAVMSRVTIPKWLKRSKRIFVVGCPLVDLYYSKKQYRKKYSIFFIFKKCFFPFK